MDRIDILEQLLAMASDDVPTSGVEAGNLYPANPVTDNWRNVRAHHGSAPFLWGVHAGLFLALHILQIHDAMKHNTCATRNRWTIQEPTFTDENGTHVVIVTKSPAVEHFLNPSGQTCPWVP